MNVINTVLVLIVLVLMLRDNNIKAIPNIKIDGKLMIEFQDESDRQESLPVDAPGIEIE